MFCGLCLVDVLLFFNKGAVVGVYFIGFDIRMHVRVFMERCEFRIDVFFAKLDFDGLG